MRDGRIELRGTSDMRERAAAFGLRFHHLGLAVPGPEQAATFLGTLGYEQGTPVYDPLQRVNLVMWEHPEMPDVEVVWPGDAPSPIDQLVRRGHMIYHLCYVTNDAEASVRAMEAVGLEVLPLGAAKPAILFDGLPVSFYQIDRVGLIEMIEAPPR